MRNMRDQAATALLTDAVWRGKTRDADAPDLEEALALARSNHVEGRLAGAYPEQLHCVSAKVKITNVLFGRNLRQVAGRLHRDGIPSVLIKAELPGMSVSRDFDLVVRERQWEQAIGALSGWYVHHEEDRLERATKARFYPPVGPAVHLHAGVSWFGVPVLPADRLLARAVPDGRGWLRPAPADHLLIGLAHAVFQNLTFDLSELLAIRDLLNREVISEARREAARQGWRAGFDGALATADAAIDRLDRGAPLTFPVPFPVSLSLWAGAEHSYHQLRRGRAGVAGREAALRIPLVAAKRPRVLT